MKIGIGYDIHKFAKGRRLILGGVEIPYARGLEGHSDADVLLHAVCDAILGALGEGDIGIHFPDSELRYKGISSLVLLSRVNDLCLKKNFRILNIDTTLVADGPRIAPFREPMKENISLALKIDKDSVNIKATTSEGAGPIGREAIAAYAAVLLAKDCSSSA